MIANSLSITIAQRAREFATVRTLGGSRRQVLVSIIVEALVVGTAASVVGLFLGLGLAKLLFWLFDAVGFTLPNSGLLFETRTIVVSLAVGIIVTLLASLRPAVRATRVPPIAAVREGATLPPSRFARFRTAGSLLITGLGFASLALRALRQRSRDDAGAPLDGRWRAPDLHRRLALRRPARRPAGGARGPSCDVGLVVAASSAPSPSRSGLSAHWLLGGGKAPARQLLAIVLAVTLVVVQVASCSACSHGRFAFDLPARRCRDGRREWARRLRDLAQCAREGEQDWPIDLRPDRVSTELAEGNSQRNPQRTASTASALMIGLALVTLVATLAAGITSTFRGAVDKIFTSDYAITAQNNFSPIPIDAAEAAAKTPGVEAIASTRSGEARVFGSTEFVTAVDPSAGEVITLEWVEGSQDVFRELGADGAFVDDGFAKDHGLQRRLARSPSPFRPASSST